ncbi:hypothetical protein M1P56_30725 [Streptomyces sp. HU2014]|uniref:hypothetical protein n=1 Tax=Streptomyces sp. HU2014 TaxID=2939414 RepID=UPI00200EC691|nr:hypothetical protein [Streptomyces sp. HU2014]UQI48382.1 hypothetical protein M1P56_30725 [Streptomyces sp. HU2014]
MRKLVSGLLARARALFVRRTPVANPRTTPTPAPAPLHIAAGAHGFNLVPRAPALSGPCRCPESVQLPLARAPIGAIVVDTVAGGSGRVVEVEPSGMVLVRHPNGFAWRSCTLRPAGPVERLNLLAEDAVRAGGVEGA